MSYYRMLDAKHLACLADGIYQILTYTPYDFLSEAEAKKLKKELSEENKFTTENIYKKLYELNKKAVQEHHSELKLISDLHMPKQYTKFIAINKNAEGNYITKLNANYILFNDLFKDFFYQCYETNTENEPIVKILYKLNFNIILKILEANNKQQLFL